MKFAKWLDTLIEEKGVDLEDTFEVETEIQTHLMSYGVVIEHCKIASDKEQAFIKDTLVKIDFKNGDIKHFFRHLGKCLALQMEAA
jgi:hypothetical protein